MFTGNIKRAIYPALLACVAITLPLSGWLLSAFTILLFIQWVLTGGIKNIYTMAREKKMIFFFLMSYLVYIIWMINTPDTGNGLDELRLKLPLIIFPVVTGFSEPLTGKEQKIVIAAFISGVVISTLAGVLNGYSHIFQGYDGQKLLSPFISHIRLALMSVFAIACAAWYFIYRRTGRWHDWLLPAAAVWLTFFLFILLSLTGIILFFLTLAVTSVLLALRTGNRNSRIMIFLILSFVIIIPASFVLLSVSSFYKPGNAYVFPLLSKTSGGKSYYHNPAMKGTENGNPVWLYLCSEELSRGWNRCSSLPFEGKDKKGQELRYTLIRYLTSAGLTKDSLGLSRMTKADITNVENGMTNRNFAFWSPWRTKLYEIIWQIDYYKNGGNPSGHSLTQRLEYYKTGIKIFSRHILFGTGTGSVEVEYKMKYASEKSKLDIPYRLLSHNQFLNFLVSFGITGTFIIIFSFFYPFLAGKGYKKYLPALFLMLLLLSMLWEDTLETHTGVSFFAYFYSVFIFGTERNENEDQRK